jgi:hypothetical protein
MFNSRVATGVACLATLALAACAPPNYAAKAPAPSGLKYVVSADAPRAAAFSMIDERRADGKIFSSGVLPAEIKIDGTPIDPIPFLARHLQAELASRGLPATVSETSSASPAIRVKHYRMENMRTNAYTPFISLTYLSADVDTPSGVKRLGVFVTRGKTPVWSFEEIIEPTLNQPLSLGVREFASKFSNAVYGLRADDDTVKSLTAKINGARTPETFLDVYALGFTNNPAAVDTLVALTKDSQEYVRQAAISSLGNIGATTQLGLLKSLYQDAQVSWQDHCLALKAIGDLNTDESKAFVAEEARRLGSDSSKESQVLGRILALYL